MLPVKLWFQITKYDRLERELNAKSTSEIVAGIQNELDKLQQSYISDIESIQTNYGSQIDDQRKIAIYRIESHQPQNWGLLNQTIKLMV